MEHRMATRARMEQINRAIARAMETVTATDPTMLVPLTDITGATIGQMVVNPLDLDLAQ